MDPNREAQLKELSNLLIGIRKSEEPSIGRDYFEKCLLQAPVLVQGLIDSEELKSRHEVIRSDLILLKIIRQALSNVKTLIKSGHWTEVFDEVDHIHNLPEVLWTHDDKYLKSYIDIFIPGYLRTRCRYAQSFKLLFEELRSL